MEPIHIISLGAGVQSSTMALMAAKGEITPMPKAAIFADTGDEPKSVYVWLDWLEKQLPFPVYRVTARKETLSEYAFAPRTSKDGRKYYKGMIPATLLAPNGTKGMAWRTCTMDFKIAPLRKKAKEICGEVFCQCRQKNRVASSPIDTVDSCKNCGKIIQESPIQIIQWIGISLDEAHRMKPSRDAWCEMRWPLIDLMMSRHNCLRWMERNSYPKPPRSACIYCPFHSDAEWRRLKTEEPDEFKKACEIEQKMFRAADRGEVLRGRPFLHGSCKPLAEVDFSTDEERGMISLFGNECEGICGV